MSISPQGYTLGGDPKNINPFWGEDEKTNWTIEAEATVDDTSGSPSVNVETSEDTTLKIKTFSFEFSGLKGADGERGEQGEQGERGAQGDPGTPGAAGKSAYEIAVEQGYIGTEEDWLASLKGEKGEDGAQGVPGVGVPSGGTTGQILKKRSDTNYDTEWADEEGGVVDYPDLTNKPSINNVTLNGNKTAEDLGLLEIVELTQAQYDALETKDPTVAYFINDADPAALGTAAFKDYTDRVQPGNRALVESQSVYSAINSALSSIYTPRGNIDYIDLTSALLVEANVGNVYELNDSGVTTSLFLQGEGVTINAGDNVGIINAGEGRILFNLMGDAFDLTGYQKEELSSSIAGQTTVEGALAELEALICPVGMITPYGGSTAPNRWLMCDGSSVSRTTYANLFAVIGTSFGTGDGSTTFNLPDLRECVPVGEGTNATSAITTHDTYTLGQFKDDQLQDHQHKIVINWNSSGGNCAAGDVQGPGGGNSTSKYNIIKNVCGINSPANADNGDARVGITTHGKQLGVNYIIKY